MQLYILAWLQIKSCYRSRCAGHTGRACTAVSLAVYCLQPSTVENPSELTGPLHTNMKLLLVVRTLLSTMSYLRYYKHLEISQKANGSWNMISCCKLEKKSFAGVISALSFVMCWIWIDKEEYPGHSLPEPVCYGCIRKRATKSTPTGALLHQVAHTGSAHPLICLHINSESCSSARGETVCLNTGSDI